VRAVAYLLGLVLSLPLLAFALGVLALGHAIETRNVFVLLYHFVLAFAWGLPLLALGLLVLLVAAVHRLSRLAGAAVLALLNVAALVVVLRATGLPGAIGEAVFLGPTVVALWLQGRLLLEAARGRAGPEPRPARPSAPSAPDAGPR
jgi:hypothetical protein